MRIVYCIAGTYNSGGMERVLANKANYLVRHGYDVSIVTTDQCGRPPFFELDERVRCYDLNIGYEDNNGKSFANKLIHYPLKQWRHKRRLSALLSRLKADVVISMFCNDVSFITRINDGSRKLLEIHFSRFKRLQYGRKGFWRWADSYRYYQEAALVRKFSRFVVLTDEDKVYWGDMDNIRVIPNPLSFTLPSPAVLTGKKVIAIGRYSYQKGFDSLIAAWRKVCDCISGWTLHIIGDGELRETLQQQIETLCLENEVFLEKPTTDMLSVYQNGALFVMSSRYEGLPMVLLEAQAAGLPIVSFACKCGPKDVITDGVDGLLVEDGNIDALAEALLHMMRDEDLRRKMGQAAYEHSKRYDESVVMKKWTDLFAEIVAS
ncbi:MAG: glycosyltransferase family 4 protein [Bacteroides sp.]|nr:glycosyltransferase family 4 protein [Roseburia sp.]MCM1346009.1 glycosyltransferase family 4 protein [Bacteroides sp.]MCM1421475.1 glycosyltransferase family 4 protein [Bacteroides sp.]